MNKFLRKGLIASALRLHGPPIFPDGTIVFFGGHLRWSHGIRGDSVWVMNTSPLQPLKLPGFKVVSKRELPDRFSSAQSAYYILLGRRGAPDCPRERVLFVHYLDDFLDVCQRQIEELWTKHRVPITHVAVKLIRNFRPAHRDLAETYERAVSVQQLRQKLQPRFRRL